MPIVRLQDHVINQIAAGEVVERPASVIKELIENSLDAGATKIDVEVTAGGKAYMRVSDNGMGINEEDLPMVFERHATSKISSLEDLEQVVSLGFRGEALASISSVAKTTVKSKTEAANSGFEILKDGPNLAAVKPISIGIGTTIIVEELFKDVPVRQKYLKTDLTEYGYIADVVIQHAATQPTVEFSLTHNGSQKLHFPRANDPLVRALEVLKLKELTDIIPISYQSQDLKVSGFVGVPQYAQKSRKRQYISVNQRPLSLPFADRAVRDAMHTLIPQGIFPIFVISIEIDPTAVDINVHPRKLEARFAYQQFVYQKLKAAVKAAVDKQTLQATVAIMPDRHLNQEPPTLAMPTTHSAVGRDYARFGGLGGGRPAAPASVQSAFLSQPTVKEVDDYNRSFSGITQVETGKLPEVQPLVQIDNSYIIARDKDGIFIVDQHAAHERIRYYELQEARKRFNNKSEKTAQPLLTPEVLEFSESELVMLTKFKTATEAVGFLYDVIPGAIELKAVPAIMHKEDYIAVFRGMAADLEQADLDGIKFSDLEERVETVLNYTACRSAIKFGRTLTYSEQLKLLETLETVENSYSCPHGRPTKIKLSFNELEKQFGRIK